MNWDDLGMDRGTGTIGARSLGDVHGTSKKKNGKTDGETDDAPTRRCQKPDCGTILRSSNQGNFCALHTIGERRGKKYTDSVALERRGRIHVVPSR